MDSEKQRTVIIQWLVNSAEREMIENYKDLIVWQRADQLASRVFDLTEGCASAHTKELLQFINVSRRSLSETRYLLDFAFRRRRMKAGGLSPCRGKAGDMCMECLYNVYSGGVTCVRM